jgi:hypothetical protein
METEKVQEVPVEKIFLLGYEKGNGYNCSCCRQTWFATEEFDSIKQVLMFLEKAKQEKTDIEPQWLREVSPVNTEFNGDLDYAIRLLGINHK